MSLTPAQSASEPWVFLLGRPPMEEYISFVIQVSPGQNVDFPLLAEQWRNAAAVVDGLTASEAGIADNRSAMPLPADLEEQATQFMSDAEVRATYALMPTRVAMVSLDDLVVYQKQINLRYADELAALIGGKDTMDERLFNFCMAVNQPEPPINRGQTAANTFMFQSISTDVRFLGAALLDASQITGYTPQGRAHSAVVLYIGYGVNALNVLKIGGRLILNNGSHRAYALMAAGIKTVPAVVQEAAREEDLGFAPLVQQNRKLYLEHSRPPMLKDYFNNSLHQIVQVPRRSRQVRLQFGMEPQDVPG
jgi:hypothetical protein